MNGTTWFRRATRLVVVLVAARAAPAYAGVDSPPGADLTLDVAPWGLFEFEDTIGPSVGIAVTGQLGGGYGLGVLYRGLGDMGGMVGAFGRFSSSPTLTPGKGFLMGTLDAGVVAGVGGLSGAAIYASATGMGGVATSTSAGLVAGVGLTTLVGASSASVSSVQVPVVSLGVILRKPGD